MDQQILIEPIEKNLKEAYLSYAMSVIVSRAIPDIRDGMKPVHRRILYSMNELGLASNKPFKKCARIAGEVLGKYHPHGDSAIYNSLVRMAQPFSLRYTLVNGQGNFGSVDGDPPAAMRYTEARMSKIAEEMLDDLDKDTVDFMPNFDDSLKEPKVLPSRIPNLLLNGTEGIAVGMASNIPPHNLTEIMDALIQMIEGKSQEEIYRTVKGPDFPTGGIIIGRDGLERAKREGRGIVRVRGRAETKDDRIFITELPYQVNKAKLIEDIAEKVKAGIIEGIADIHDRSDKDGMTIEVKVKKGHSAEIVLNKLYEHTTLQSSFGIINIALVDGKPKLLTLYDMLSEFLKFREDTVKRRIMFLLRKAEERDHIVLGLLKALEKIDSVIKTIRASKDNSDAQAKLIALLSISDKQAKSILEMRLQTLTGLETEKLKKEHQDLLSSITDYRETLANKQKLLNLIKNEFLEIRQKYGDKRKTEITEGSGDINYEEMIEDADVVITRSKKGYLKRILLSEFKTQGRGGKGVKISGGEEEIEDTLITDNKTMLLVFSNKGIVRWIKAYNVPKSERYSKGTHIANITPLDQDEVVVSILPVKNLENGQLIFATKNGIVKKVALSNFSNPRKGGIIATKLPENDMLCEVKISENNEDIMIATRNGYAIRFKPDDLREIGRNTYGVRGIRLREGDELIGIEILRKPFAVLVSEKGYGKIIDISEFKVQHRGGMGVIGIRANEKTGKAMALKSAEKENILFLASSDGKSIMTRISEIREVSRYASGVRLMRLEGDDRVVSASVISADMAEGDLAPVPNPPPEPLVEEKEEGEAPESEGKGDGEEQA
jgi:DNA gyrase subunit A